MKSSFNLAMAACLAALTVPASLHAQERPAGGGRGAAMGGGFDPSQMGGARQQAEDTRPIDEFTKDAVKLPGVVTFYRQKKGATDTIYAEVPESLLGKLFLLQITSGSGLGDTTNSSVYHGQPIDDVPIRIEKQDDNKLVFFKPNLAHRSTVPEVTRMITRSFPSEIIATFDIRSRQASRKSVLIDVSSFFKSDISDLSATVESGYGLNPASTYVDSVKVFPENAVIRTVFGLTRRGAAGSSPKNVPWAVSFNLSLLPEGNGYKPRLGDPRVGYFTQNYQNHDDQTNRDQNVNFIERWQLEKVDPKAAVSKVKKPIVFYIDNAVPKEFRDDVRRGILMWNPAFEKLGFKDAIEVRQMPDDADWDIADLRYNTVRWTTGMPFAIALMRANPLTGQILNACINFDGVFAAGANGEFDEIVSPNSYYNQAAPQVPAKYKDLLCDFPSSSARIASEGETLFEAFQTPDAPFNRNAYIHQRMTEVVAHEMGHCLGLRHNFIASTEYTLKQLGDAAFVKQHGTASSVMDYVPYNTAALKKKGVDYYQTTVGDYDKFAISYGYTPVESETPEGERYALSQIASKGSQPGHRFLTDGTADDFDPSDVRYDFAADTLDWAARQMDLGKYLLQSSVTRRLTKGESYYAFTRSWNGALNTYLRAAAYVPRFVGGVNLSNSFVGDENGKLPITPVDVAKQKKALSVLNTYVFGEQAFNISKADLAKLSFNPNSPGNETQGRQRLFPIRTSISTFQSSTLEQLFAPAVLSRIVNNEFRTSDTLTLAGLFNSVDAAVWAELANGHEISPLRRDLQRTFITVLSNFLVKPNATVPADAKTLARAELLSLKSRLAVTKPKGGYGAAHLSESIARINQALNAQISLGDDAPAAPAFPARRGG